MVAIQTPAELRAALRFAGFFFAFRFAICSSLVSEHHHPIDDQPIGHCIAKRPVDLPPGFGIAIVPAPFDFSLEVALKRRHPRADIHD
jgi:hypothetical protein